jgi:NAD-dependent deacetylase
MADAGAVVVLTGAGVSAESGVPTFRGEDGLWRNFRAEELATPGAFARDPKLVWEWYTSLSPASSASTAATSSS